MRLPHLELPALAITGGGAWLAPPSGDVRQLTEREARDLISVGDVLICHAMFVVARLGRAAGEIPLRRARAVRVRATGRTHASPSPLGLARALRFREPQTAEDFCARATCGRRCAAGRFAEGLSRRRRIVRARPRARWSKPAGGGPFRARRTWRTGARSFTALGVQLLAQSRAVGRRSTRRESPSQHAIDEDSAQARLQATVRPLRRRAKTATRVHQRGDAGVLTAHASGRAAHRARRGGDGHRQDARLSRAGLPVGRAQRARGCGSPPTRATCSARSCRRRRSSIPIRRSATRRWSCARAARTISAC